MAFLMLAIGYYMGENKTFIKAGGYFGLCTALLAWYNAIAGLLNRGNSFLTIPLGRFPWAEK
jgi:uncharacterized protein